MNTPAPINEFLLLIRGTHWDHGMSRDEMQRVMSGFNVWADGLAISGVLRAAQPLLAEGEIVRHASVFDGPFAESKEAIGGYFLIAAPTIEDAVRHAQACPSSPAMATSKCALWATWADVMSDC